MVVLVVFQKFFDTTYLVVPISADASNSLHTQKVWSVQFDGSSFESKTKVMFHKCEYSSKQHPVQSHFDFLKDCFQPLRLYSFENSEALKF